MELRDFGKRSGLQVAPVSIGAMRLPEDCVDAVKLIRHAIDSGMRYIDTSRGYGESEFKLGKALKDGYREKVILSTKCSPWIKKVRGDEDGSADSVYRSIEESMARLDVDYLDFYQVWNIMNRDCWETATKPGGMVDGIKRAMKDGLVKHTGFTTHDSVENLLEYLPQADWCEILLISYNLLNLDYAPVMEKAKELGIGTIVMNPVGGGKFAEESPVLHKLAESVGCESIPELAVRYVLSNPNVDTIINGISKLSDVDGTIKAAEKGAFSKEQMARIDAWHEEFSRENQHFCTACGYCMPCPTGINIPKIMGLVFEDKFLGLKNAAKGGYRWAGKVKADACIMCGACEKKCTQQLEIIKEMTYAAQEYGDSDN
ncbi:MAG: aldo/keto reductase [Candidatus Sumerlaeia bacterium]